MFKLFKDLTRAPEPLAVPDAGARSRSGSASAAADSGVQGASGILLPGASGFSVASTAAPAPEVETEESDEDEVRETDPRAIEVVALVHSLLDCEGTMAYVETFSHLVSVPGRLGTRRAFRRHAGFARLMDALEGLQYKPRPNDIDEAEWQVFEVQRTEGLRLWFEVLAWATSDREGERYFETKHGYDSLLPHLRRLSENKQHPRPEILGLLLSHALNSNYSLRAQFSSAESIQEALHLDTAALEDKLGDVQLRWPAVLPLLWSYLWGTSPPRSPKGKERVSFSESKDKAAEIPSGKLEVDRANIVLLTFRILDLAAKSSSNLFLIRSSLPQLGEFLLTRIYGWERKRIYNVTFPARDEWYQNAHAEEDEAKPEWLAPNAQLREAYLSLLRKVLAVGVTPQQTWRLFDLVRKVPPKPPKPKTPADSAPGSGAATPRPGSPNGDNTPSKKAKLPLKIVVPKIEEPHETLDAEVLGLIQHAMKGQTPSAFVFRGGRDNAEGGLEVQDLGRAWPNSTKGVMFSCWVYISKLNDAVTLLHLSQPGHKHPLLHVRVLENSQIAMAATAYNEKEKAEGVPDEVICGAPEALIPHHDAQGGGGEARLFINGRRVGVVRITYPHPKPAPKQVANPHRHHPHGPPLHVHPPQAPTECIKISVGRPWLPEEGSGVEASPLGSAETNEWMLGRSLLLEEVVSEDLVLLMNHLGPRYYGNFQEALGKFLSYEDATSINVYLHGLATAAAQKTLPLLPANSALVRAISAGPAIAEENIMASLCAKDRLPPAPKDKGDFVLNGAIPHSARARDFKYGKAELVGNVYSYSASDLDVAVSTVGGPVVILKLIDLARNAEELETTLGVLHEMLRHSWRASEEMERIHGFELLAAILRPKMSTIMNVACAIEIFSLLGVSMSDPESTTVHCSAGYRALGLDFELWAHAPPDVVGAYFEHFTFLLSRSKHKRFNLLRTFQKSNAVRKLLYAIRSGCFVPGMIPSAVDILQLFLVSRWSAEDAIKPVFSYLVSALCQNAAPSYLIATAEPTQAQYPAALILEMLSGLLTNPKRLVKLNRSLSLHRLLVIFMQSNPAPYVASPCLDIIALCLRTPGVESFQRQFESEGGFALLAKTLAPVWNDHVQDTMFSIMFGPTGPAASSLACTAAIPCLMAALDALLQAASAGESGNGDALSQSIGSIRSLSIRPMPHADDDDHEDTPDDDRLEKLLTKLAEVYRQSSAFRRALTVRRIEGMLPSVVDFVAMSATSMRPERTDSQRAAAASWLSALVDLSKAPATVITQMKLLIEQLKSTSTALGRTPSGRSMTSVPHTPTKPPLLRRTSSTLSTSMTSSGIASSPTAFSPIRRQRSTENPITNFRRMTSIEKRVPLRRTLTGESILQDEQDKNAAWRMIILSTDAQKHATMTLERKEHWHRLSQVEWPRQVAVLRAENGVWAELETTVIWRLDGSEGPLRMRNKLERVDGLTEGGSSKTRNKSRDAIPAHDELSSAVSRLNAAPWEDPFALALGEAAPIAEEDQPAPTQPKPTTEGGDESEDESYQEVDDDSSNKMRLVAKALQAGDVVEEAHNIVRIVGVDALPGLLILGKRNLYLIDGLVRTPEGTVIEADQAPRDVLSIPSGTLADLDASDQRSHRWPYSDVVETNKRAFLFRDVALELYFADKQNLLIVFKDRRERSAVVQKMGIKVGTGPRSIVNSLLLDTIARAVIDSRAGQLDDLTRRWQSREISNFAYLQMLNQHANRTPNDVTQYPVFPWVVADYTSQILDLSKPASYRDLSLPMGALTQSRKDAAVERYQATEGVGETPFHYGTHYTSSMIVCGYMIRLSPFTEIFLALQGGNFDLADRLFSSIPRAWDSASNTNRGDVRELIPEFYYSGAFLVNLNHHDFGKKQVSGESVDDVVLPPWALGDQRLFVHLNREALESDYVSKHLPAWIDLTFGYKQRDPASFNCFHPLSYRGAVDLDKITDEGEKAASTAIIHNFGQTPFQIFKNPHPHKYLGGRTTLPSGTRFGVAEHWQLLMRSIMPITQTTARIHHIIDPHPPDQPPTVHQKHRLVVPGHRQLSVQYGFADDSIRVYFQETGQRLVHIVEGIDVQHASFVAHTLLVTVSSLGVITAWRMDVKGTGYRRGETTLRREATLRGHGKPVTCIAASTDWNFLVTGSEDGTVMVWDMNRLRYTRALETPRREPIRFVTVNETSGNIAVASDKYLYMYSLNGHPIAATSVDGGRFPALRFEDAPAAPQRYTGGIAFLKRDFLRWGDLLVIGVGADVAIYRCIPGVRRFEDQDVEPWRLVKQGTLQQPEYAHGDVTALKFVGETLYAAFEAPKGSKKYPLHQWSLPDSNARHVPEYISACMAAGCGRSFGLLEPRRHCGGCGGVFCGSHALHVELFDSRYCDTCRSQLAHGSSLGLLGSRAVSRAVSAQGSRVGSVAPSRRQSIDHGRIEGTPSRSRSASRTPSRSGTPSRSVSVSRDGDGK